MIPSILRAPSTTGRTITWPSHLSRIELVAQAKARAAAPVPGSRAVVRIGNLSYDVLNREVCVDQRPIVVPRRELAILEAMVRRIGRVVLRERVPGSCGLAILMMKYSRTRSRYTFRGCADAFARPHRKIATKPVRGLGYLLSGE